MSSYLEEIPEQGSHIGFVITLMLLFSIFGVFLNQALDVNPFIAEDHSDQRRNSSLTVTLN